MHFKSEVTGKRNIKQLDEQNPQMPNDRSLLQRL